MNLQDMSFAQFLYALCERNEKLKRKRAEEKEIVTLYADGELVAESEQIEPEGQQN